ncbi:HAMP domain-containing sensor histidine kinase [uncultured Aquimarina sp.]|uniref:sensor histidine kinase n=1 Tax=uncultured Aquimarina sp. TaxID=575652 RepID=UPI0026065B68|nr:HAMP domain-containing sensor histidine kinase [uncultured Aquimarina sp.]
MKLKFIDQFNKNLNKSNSLKNIRWNIHLIILILLLIETIFITPFRFFNFPIGITYVNLCEISIYSCSLFLFYRKKYNLSILITAYGIPVIFTVVLIWLHTLKSMLWFLLSFEITYILIITGKHKRIIYALVCAAIFYIPGVFITYIYPEYIIKYIQLFTLTIIPIIISNFIESQDNKLQNLNLKLKEKYEERKIYAEQIDEKNQELVMFSQCMSHDLKSPLNNIKSFASLLQNNIEKESNLEENKKFLNFISESAISMSELINDLLMYSNIENYDYSKEIVDLNSLIDEVLSLFQFDLDQNKVEINVEKLPSIQGNNFILNIVFQNLISNAIKYQPKDTTAHHPIINIFSKTDDISSYIYIQDNGIGIEEEYIENLFTPFKRSHNSSEYQGTGLGMYICQRIIKKHNGKIQLKSTSIEGSTFELSFLKVQE